MPITQKQPMIPTMDNMQNHQSTNNPGVEPKIKVINFIEAMLIIENFSLKICKQIVKQ